MPAFAAIAARLAASLGAGGALGILWTFVRQLLLWGGITFAAYKLEKAGTPDAVAGAATEIAKTTGGTAKAVGSVANVANDTPAIAILLGGAALLLVLIKR